MDVMMVGTFQLQKHQICLAEHHLRTATHLHKQQAAAQIAEDHFGRYQDNKNRHTPVLTKHQNSHTSKTKMPEILPFGTQHENTNAVRYLLEFVKRLVYDGMWMKRQEQVKTSRSK